MRFVGFKPDAAPDYCCSTIGSSIISICLSGIRIPRMAPPEGQPSLGLFLGSDCDDVDQVVEAVEVAGVAGVEPEPNARVRWPRSAGPSIVLAADVPPRRRLPPLARSFLPRLHPGAAHERRSLV